MIGIELNEGFRTEPFLNVGPDHANLVDAC